VPWWLPLPQARAGTSLGALGVAAGVLCVVASLGAALVHIVEYHLGLGRVGDQPASIAFMLAHCPVRGGLLVVIIVAMVTVLALFAELRALALRHRRLTLAARHVSELGSLPRARAPLRPGRLVAVFVPLLCGQIGLYALAERVMPMTVRMSMHGELMNMAVQGATPPLPVHLIVALVLATLVWHLERRFVVLQVAITALRRLLRLALLRPHRVRRARAPLLPLLARWCGPGVLSRPPPA